MSGQQKLFLPLTEGIAENLWEKAWNRVDPLSVVTAQYNAGQNVCSVSVTSSTVARPISHAATQTSKSVLLKQRKKTRLTRKEKVGKQNESNDDYSGMLVRLVQLLYLQTKLNASNADKTKAANIETTGYSHAGWFPASSNSTINNYLQKHQQRRYAAPPNAHYARPTTQIGLFLHTRPQSSSHGARVYRAGSSQAYSKNYSSVQFGSTKSESTNNWMIPVNSTTVYVDKAQSEMTPWTSPTATAFTPSCRQRYHNYNNRLSKISSYPGSLNTWTQHCALLSPIKSYNNNT